MTGTFLHCPCRKSLNGSITDDRSINTSEPVNNYMPHTIFYIPDHTQYSLFSQYPNQFLLFMNILILKSGSPYLMSFLAALPDPENAHQAEPCRPMFKNSYMKMMLSRYSK